MKTLDYVIVGSGPSGAMVAQTLIEAGVDVTMIDAGIVSTDPSLELPKGKDFLTLRSSHADQYKYFIGQKAEGINWGDISKGAQVTPPRQYMIDRTDTYIPFVSKSFSPMQSLGYGGLGIGWGVQCWAYSDNDLHETGLNSKEIREAYEVVSSRIGISATRDAASSYTIAGLKQFQPSAHVDRNHRYIQSRYQKLGNHFRKGGFYVGRTPLALLTKAHKERKAYRYLDTDFYSDADKSAWRPWITINQLRKKSNFHYIGNILVTSFEEHDGIVTISALDIKNGKGREFKARKFILATGALGSARIVMRSQGKIGTKVPVLSNPHSYIPCVQPKFFGRGYESKKLGFGQLSYFMDPEGKDSGVSVASSYSYQSLMLFRIIAQLPFNFADGRTLAQYLTPGLVILIAQHPDYASDNKYLKLIKDTGSPTGDAIEAHYEVSPEDETRWNKREKRLMAYMRQLHTIPVKRVKTEHGSGIHYAGTLPFSDKEKPLHLAKTGRLHGTHNVYVADSSGFLFLPAKGLTFTIMANAHNVARHVLEGDV